VNSYKSRGIPFAAGRELLPGANGETAFSSRVRGERGDFVNPFAVRIVDGTLVARAVIRDIKERKKRKEKEKKKKKEKGKKRDLASPCLDSSIGAERDILAVVAA
jgi:hypothetical protein